MMTRLFPVVTLLATALLATACDRTETRSANVASTAAKQRANALVRVVHAVPSGTTFDLFAGDLVLFDGVGFKAVTPYRAVDSKRYAFALRPAGMTQAKPLSSNTEDVKDGDFYTAIAMPGDGHGPQLRVVKDHLDSPASGKARLRVVQAGTDAGKLDVRSADGTGALFDNLDYQSISDYRDVAPMNGEMQIVNSGQSSPLTTTTAHLEAGRFYTLVIVGNASGPNKIDAFLIEDALTP
ncbi:MAG TPA: DUF4397 domain-containing protein [Vicinamibacterales bacterium]|nr:DUF4397 domain-containing protein [Vicinamibacterales bacterium]